MSCPTCGCNCGLSPAEVAQHGHVWRPEGNAAYCYGRMVAALEAKVPDEAGYYARKVARWVIPDRLREVAR